jgi:hypothetical protein
LPQNERSQDQAVLAFLKGLDVKDEEEHAPATTARLSDDVDESLRVMGYNRPERERLRRKSSPATDVARFRATTIKRFRYYLAELLTEYPAAEIAELAETWAALTDYNIDLARQWWATGLDPANPGQLARALTAGLQVKDLQRVIGRHTVAEHLQAGSPLRWVMAALGWESST